MRYSCFLLLCLLSFGLCPTRTQAQQTASPADSSWQRIALPDGASVEMPAGTGKSPVSTATMLAYTTTYQNAIYTFVTTPIAATEFSFLGGEPTADQLNQVYEATLKGMMGSDQSTRIVARRSVDVAGHQGLEVKIDAPGSSSLSHAKFARVLYAQPSLYLFTWRAAAAHDTTDEPASRTRFFNSLKVKSQPVTPISDARQAGRSTGRLLVIVAVLAGIFLLVRRARRASR